MTHQWTDAERTLLDAILDQIIPANETQNIPAAGATGIADFLSGRAAADDDLASLLRYGLEQALILTQARGSKFEALGSEAKVDVLRQLEMREPTFFKALLRHTYMGYYSRPEIRALFGLSAMPTQPKGYAVPPEPSEEIAMFVQPVKTRGRCYRAC